MGNLVGLTHKKRYTTVVLIDSDRRKESDSLNSTERILREVVSTGGYGWVTAGKKIENYIPVSSLRELCGKAGIKGPNQFYDFFDYAKGKTDTKGRRIPKDKIKLADRVIPLIKKEQLAETYDLAERLDAVVERIRRWNQLPHPAPAAPSDEEPAEGEA